MTTSTSPHADLSALAQVERQTQQRLAALTAKEQADLLSLEELSERANLQARLRSISPRLDALSRRVQAHRQALDVQQVKTAWEDLRRQKIAAHEQFYQSIAAMRAAFQHIAQIHEQQEALVQRLPRDLKDRMAFVDVGSLRSNILGRLPAGHAWQQIFTPGEASRAIPTDEVMDIDSGVKPLPSFIARYTPEENYHG